MKLGIIIIFILIGMIIFNGCEKEITLIETNEVQTKYDTLNVSSNPLGASVYINGRNTGYKTPCKISWIEVQALNITLKLSPYWDGKVTIPENIEQKLCYYDFLADDRNFGGIDCLSTPSGASIYLNGININKKTPYTIELLRPGYYTVNYRLFNHRSDSTVLDVKARNNDTDYKNTFFNSNLIDTSKFVDYTREIYNHGWDKIFINADRDLLVYSQYLGIYLFDGIKRLTRKFDSFGYILATSGFQDSKGNYWFATKYGLLRVTSGSPNKLFTIGKETPLVSNIINSVCEDMDQNLWVATYFGIYKCNLNSKMAFADWVRYDKADYPILFGNNVSNIVASPDGSVWASFFGLGVSRYLNGRWTNYTTQNSALPDSYITFMFCKNNDAVYFATNTSVFKFSNEQWKTIPVEGMTTVKDLYVDNSNTVFIACPTSIITIKNTGISENVSTLAPGLASPIDIKSIGVDASKMVWLGTSNYGIVRYKYYKK